MKKKLTKEQEVFLDDCIELLDENKKRKGKLVFK